MPTRKASPQRKPHHREDEQYHAAEKSYGAAMQLFTRQSWGKAREAFLVFLKDHADDREFPDMVDRARTHLKICERKLAPAPADPQTADEWLIRAVAHGNCGEIEPALAAFQKALDGGAPAARVHYARAAALALSERPDAALEDLARAIEGDPQLRFQSLADPDFENLRESAGYVSLVEPPRGYDDADDMDDEDEDDDADEPGERGDHGL